MDREDPSWRNPNSQPMTQEFYNGLPPQIQGFLSQIAGRFGRPIESMFAPSVQQAPQGQLSQFLQGLPAGAQGALSQFTNQTQAFPQQQTQAPQQPMQSFNNPWSNGLMNRLQRNW